jgi:hypothetical protein
MIPIQLSQELRQVFRHRGASGVGEFGPQSGRKRQQELHRVEGDGGQTAHPNAPTDLLAPTVRALCCESDRGGFVPTRREDFRGRWSWTGATSMFTPRSLRAITEHAQRPWRANGACQATTVNSVLGSVQLWS